MTARAEVRDDRRVGARGGLARATRPHIGLLLVLAAAAIVLGIVGWAVHASRVAPLRRPVVTVDGRSVPMTYLIARLAGGGEPLTMVDTLAREQITAIAAPRPPFGVHVSDADVDADLRRIAAAGRTALDDADYAAWRRRALNDSRMTEEDFLLTARAGLIRQRMADRLATQLPAMLPQVRLHMLAVGSLDDAERVRERLREGEDFGAVATRVSVDPQLRSSAGEVGWTPRAALSPAIADVAFDRLAVGEVSAPLPRADAPGVVLLMVSERSPARAVAADVRRRVGLRRLDDWLDRTYADHVIILTGLDGGYDSRTDAWVRQQVIRRRPVGDS